MSSDTESYWEPYVEVAERLRTTLRSDFSMLKKKRPQTHGCGSEDVVVLCAINSRNVAPVGDSVVPEKWCRVYTTSQNGLSTT